MRIGPGDLRKQQIAQLGFSKSPVVMKNECTDPPLGRCVWFSNTSLLWINWVKNPSEPLTHSHLTTWLLIYTNHKFVETQINAHLEFFECILSHTSKWKFAQWAQLPEVSRVLFSELWPCGAETGTLGPICQGRQSVVLPRFGFRGVIDCKH